MSVMCVGVSLPAHAEEIAVPAPAFEVKFDLPKTWTPVAAKRGAVDVTVYTIVGVKDALFVVYPPGNSYGITIQTAIDSFMTRGLGVKVLSRYPKKLRQRTSWLGLKHAKQQALVKAKRGYGLRVVYAFVVKEFIQIAVGEARSSRMVKRVLTALSPVTMGAGVQPRSQAKPPPPKPAPPKPAPTKPPASAKPPAPATAPAPTTQPSK